MYSCTIDVLGIDFLQYILNRSCEMSFISEYISGVFGNNPGINENGHILEQKFDEGKITKFDEAA